MDAKFFVINKKVITIKFKSLINIRFVSSKYPDSPITKRIFGLQGLKYFEKQGLKINTSKFFLLQNKNIEALFLDVVKERLFLIINPKLIYKIENKKGFLDLLVQHSDEAISIGSGNLIKNTILEKNEMFIGEISITAIFS